MLYSQGQSCRSNVRQKSHARELETLRDGALALFTVTPARQLELEQILVQLSTKWSSWLVFSSSIV